METPLCLHLLVLVVLLPFSSSAASNPCDLSFIKCLQGRTPNPADPIFSTIYALGKPNYTTTLQAYIRNARFNTTSTPKPIFIMAPLNEAHVQSAVICAKAINIQIKIRSGGHDYEGVSYVSTAQSFMILDMFNLRSIDIDTAAQSAWVQSGATLGELYYRIWEKSKGHGFPAGVCPTVGIGGHISGGGYGNMIRKHGLAVDYITDAKIVDVNGRLLDRKGMGEDLFWAIRGGGGASFGVILAYKIQLVPVPPSVTVFRVERYLEEGATNVVTKWQQVAPSTDDGLFMRMLVQPVSSKVKKGEKTIRISILALYLGTADTLVTLLKKDFPELGLKKENCTEGSWIQSVLWWANYEDLQKVNVLLQRTPDKVNFGRRKSDYVQTPITPGGLESIWKTMIGLGKVGLVFNPYGGKMNQIPASATPFPHRAGNLFKIQYSVNWDEPGDVMDKNYTAQIRSLHSFMTPFVSKNPRSSFLNYRDLDIGTNRHDMNSYADGKVYGEKYFNGNFDRLVKVKTAVDPDNFFWSEQSIPIAKK